MLLTKINKLFDIEDQPALGRYLVYGSWLLVAVAFIMIWSK